MSLPPRQQAILDQIEHFLQAADPRLKSMFAAFHRSVKAQDMPDREAMSGMPARRVVLICVVVVSLLGGFVVGIRATAHDCPGLSSDQVVASAAVRYAGCSKSTDAWSRGAR
jgi:Protein of unknown function (DUF3040)